MTRKARSVQAAGDEPGAAVDLLVPEAAVTTGRYWHELVEEDQVEDLVLGRSDAVAEPHDLVGVTRG